MTFTGKLHPEQQTAAQSLLAHDIGVLSATTAFGKTVVAAWLIAQRGVNTLVLVHRRQLLNQWIDRLEAFLNLDRKRIGQMGGGKKKTDGELDVAVIQSLVRKEVVNDLVDGYGHLIVDECHHLVSWRGTIAQYVGRLHRLHDGKTEVRVYDYADLNVPMLARMFDRRCAGYEAVGYTVLLPGSAVPGWPVEVPLPVDPEWKNEYAATVRRLVRDGIDRPLAKLFVHVAREIDSSSQGLERARSATEAFFYRRLETLPETAGRFQLNAELPISFDGWGKMEVDLFCRDARLVIELDGGQHLSNMDAYRRDRRKDALLQEHGYLVLRFLAEDVGKRLDYVLDITLRMLSRRRLPIA